MKTQFLDVRTAVRKDEELIRVAGEDSQVSASVDLNVLRSIPGQPFVYWISPDLRSLFSTLQPLGSVAVDMTVGMQTSNDLRFLRCWWEAPLDSAVRWRSFAKGGSQSPFYSDVPMSVLWESEGVEVKAFAATTPGSTHWSRNIRSTNAYFKPGLTFPARPNRRGWMYLVSGAAFGHLSPMVFLESKSELRAYLAVLNSSSFHYLAQLLMSRGHGDSNQTLTYEKGLVATVPVPPLGQHVELLVSLGSLGWSLKRASDTANELSHAFVLPGVLQISHGSFAERVEAWADRIGDADTALNRVQAEIDATCFELYGISDEDRRAITESFVVDVADEDEAERPAGLDPVGLAMGLVSWAVGVSVGRFDVRLATGDREWPVEPDSFDPLPMSSPGMLTGDDGLRLASLPGGYPLELTHVMVQDPGHELDLAARVRAVFDVVFGADSDSWWSDVGAALDSRNGIEGWLQNGFFGHHLTLHSKSRRKAPVMSPLGTKSGSFLVWLYAHQVSGDSLFRVLTDVVDPKLASERRRLSDSTQEFGSSPSASQRKSLDQQQTFVDELIEFGDELRALAPLWNPDLNDGIVIVLAPLWRLFAHHRAWSNELKSRWVKLAKGEYDWAQLAMHIWPERVVPKCAEDRSLAIAHGLEDIFWFQDDDKPDKWYARQTPTTSINQLIADRADSAVANARNHPTP